MPENENITTYPEEPTNPSGYEGFNKSVYYILSLLRYMYYSKVESENKFYTKNGGTITGSVTIQGNLVVNGQSYSIDTENLKVGDYTITLAKDNEQTLTSMVGMVVPKYDGTNYGFFGWDADGYAYVGDLTNYDGSSAITLANNSSLQRISTIDTTNTVVASNGVIYVYDATSHCFKKPTNDNKYYVIRNGAFVETELFTEQKSKNIDNALYNVGAFDTYSVSNGVVSVVRKIGILLPSDLLKGTWTRNANQTSTGYYFNANFNISVSSSVDADTIAPIKNNLGFTPIKRKSIYYGGAADNTIGMQYYDSNTVGINIKCDTYTTVDSFIANVVSKLEVVYQLATSYTEQVIENQPLLNLDSNGCNFLREEWEKGLNLFDINNWEMTQAKSYVVDIKGNGTYTISANQTVYDFSIANYENGSYTNVHDHANKNVNEFTFTIDNYNPALKYYCLIRVQVGSAYPYDADLSGYGIMLNEDNHPYPYQEYNGAIVHKVDIDPVLLWENSSPTDAFSGGNITVKDMSKYSFIVIEYKFYRSGNWNYQYTKIKYNTQLNMLSNANLESSVELISRKFAITSQTNVNFSSAYNSSIQTANDYLIPTAIYGTNVL